MSRTHKKDYTGSKAVAPSCRNKGECPACRENKHSSAEMSFSEYLIEAYCQDRTFTDAT